MKEQGVARPELTEQDASDLFAYFYAARYFDPRGDAARGKAQFVAGDVANGRRIFVADNCAACHENALVPSPKLPSSGKRYSVISMVPVLWKHGPVMLQRIELKDLPWPHFQKNDIADLAAYLSGSSAAAPAQRR